MNAEINWVFPQRGATRNSNGTKLAFLVRNYKSNKQSMRDTQGVITVYAAAMKDLRWQVGDRIMVGLGADGSDVYLKRVTTGGYALSALGGDKGRSKTGTHSNAAIKTNRVQFVREAGIAPGEYMVTDDGTVMFTLPADGSAK
jgi:hypothetical protein